MPDLIFPGTAIFPGVDQQFVIKPEAHAVIDLYLKEIGSALEVEPPGPTDGEIISRDLGGRGILAPVMVDLFFIPDQNRITLEMPVVEVLGFPVIEAVDPLPFQSYTRIIPAVVIL